MGKDTSEKQTNPEPEAGNISEDRGQTQRTDHHPGTFARILFCTDFSANADAAFPFALNEALRNKNSELHILHVVPESEAQFWKSYMYEVEEIDEKAKRDIDEYIDRVYRSQVPQEQSLTVECRVGNEAQEILAYAENNDIDLIIMGRQGKSRLESVLFGKVTEKIARHADCAVLIIPGSYLQRTTSET